MTSTTTRVVSILGVCIAATMVAVILVLPRLTGGAALTVLSGSMEPTLPVGSIVVVRPVAPDAVEVGDVITYANTGGGSLTTHRVKGIEIASDEGFLFTTKGDANRGNDADPVPGDAVRGRVWFHIPYLGELRDSVATPSGLVVLALLAGLSAAWEPIASFVRRRSENASRVPVAESGSLPIQSENVPAIAEARPEGPTASVRPTHETTTAAGDPDVSHSVQLPGVTVDIHATTRVEQQLMLARLNIGGLARGKVIELLDLTRGHVVSIGAFHMVVSVTGTPEHIDGVEQLLLPYGLVEASRSAIVHVGGESAPENHAQQPPESAKDPVTNLSSIVLGPPAPPSLALAGASPNGHSRESNGQ